MQARYFYADFMLKLFNFNIIQHLNKAFISLKTMTLTSFVQI